MCIRAQLVSHSGCTWTCQSLLQAHIPDHCDGLPLTLMAGRRFPRHALLSLNQKTTTLQDGAGGSLGQEGQSHGRLCWSVGEAGVLCEVCLRWLCKVNLLFHSEPAALSGWFLPPGTEAPQQECFPLVHVTPSHHPKPPLSFSSSFLSPWHPLAAGLPLSTF